MISPTATKMTDEAGNLHPAAADIKNSCLMTVAVGCSFSSKNLDPGTRPVNYTQACATCLVEITRFSSY